jgi:hypothetical protein
LRRRRLLVLPQRGNDEGGRIFAKGMMSRWFCKVVGIRFFFFYILAMENISKNVGVALTSHV